MLWVNVKTLDPDGPSAESDMRLWNAALTQACHQYPNLRVFDWAAVAQDGWFSSDGIHYTSAGYAARARLIAHALAHAFPDTGTAPAAWSANPQHKPARGPVQRLHRPAGGSAQTRAVSLRNRQTAPTAKMASQTRALTAQVHCTPSPSSGACTSWFSP